MIMEWKKQIDGTHQGTWRGTQLVLLNDPVTHRCCMTANGILVKQNWPNLKKAMDEIERRQNKVVLQLAQERLVHIGATA